MLRMPLVAMGPDCVPLLERCVRGVVVDRGWEERVVPAALERVHPETPAVSDPNAGLRRLKTVMRAIEIGKKLCDEQLQKSVLHAKRPLTELAASFGLTLSEARMCVRVFLLDERGEITKGADIERAERDAGIRDEFGFVREEFR